jgi:hypothetical protein
MKKDTGSDKKQLNVSGQPRYLPRRTNKQRLKILCDKYPAIAKLAKMLDLDPKD